MLNLYYNKRFWEYVDTPYWHSVSGEVMSVMAWSTMEIRFVYFLFVEWTLHSPWFYQQSNYTNLHFKCQIDVISKTKSYFNVILEIVPWLGLPKNLLDSPRGEGKWFSSWPNMSWKTRSDWLIFLSEEISSPDTEYLVKWLGTLLEYRVIWQCTADNMYNGVIMQF